MEIPADFYILPIESQNYKRPKRHFQVGVIAKPIKWAKIGNKIGRVKRYKKYNKKTG
jgi:hypothetical protein